MKVLTVVGNRPQFVKAAAISRHLRRHATETLVHSGQHYDEALSAVFFEELPLPHPDHLLGVGSGSHAEQTAATMTRLEPLVRSERADAMLIYGDTNTTLAAALVAAKLPVPLVHVEAGMRSFDRSMPEEVNRIVADRLGQLLLCPTEAAVANLRAEGLTERARLVGDPMADVALELGPVAQRRSTVLQRLELDPQSYLVATLHRAGNVDDPTALSGAVGLLTAAAGSHGPLVLPLHPRTRTRLEAGGLGERLEEAGVLVIEPLGYLDFNCLLAGARALLTDSGGLQKEAYLAGVPCLTLRRETEWVETVEAGWNRLVGLDREAAMAALEEALEPRPLAPPDAGLYGGGEAGKRCVQALLDWGATAS